MKTLLRVGLGAVAVVVIASLLPSPFGSVRQAPAAPVLTGAAADAGTRALLQRACADCHSQQTEWPWYSSVAPASWLIERDVAEARKFFNLSAWPEYGPAGQSQLLAAAAAQLESQAMPPSRYLALHPQARLTPQERSALASWCNREAQRVAPHEDHPKEKQNP